MNETLFPLECSTCNGSKRVWSDAAAAYIACPSCTRVDKDLGTQLKRAAIAQVDENANERWKLAAKSIARYLAKNREEFTTDAVWFMLDKTEEVTHEPRAMGAVMTALARERVIIATDRTVESVRPENHRRPVRVWRSLTYKEVTL